MKPPRLRFTVRARAEGVVFLERFQERNRVPSAGARVIRPGLHGTGESVFRLESSCHFRMDVVRQLAKSLAFLQKPNSFLERVLSGIVGAILGRQDSDGCRDDCAGRIE